MLCIPEHVARQLDLETESVREVSVADGRTATVPYVGPVRVAFGKRFCYVGALVIGDEVLLGSVPMEDMDLVVNPGRRQLTVDPASPDVPHARVKSAVSQLGRQRVQRRAGQALRTTRMPAATNSPATARPIAPAALVTTATWFRSVRPASARHGQVCQLRGADVGQRDRRSGAGEGARDRFTDTAAGAGDDGRDVRRRPLHRDSGTATTRLRGAIHHLYVEDPGRAGTGPVRQSGRLVGCERLQARPGSPRAAPGVPPEGECPRFDSMPRAGPSPRQAWR